ncbi:MAG: 50S ribosomal protein L13 [candidate division TM6 bacterium GW2011_GWF2_38_10]|nr:MAG: 50S ribosomal protein L13 [candidate division TM6 bacterium GW2011_GWF2_38_10]
MDMNKSFVMRKEDRAPEWHVVDASGKVLGRLCTEIATRLRGKDKAVFTPHTDGGDYIVVTNCEKIVLTGNKWEDKIYDFYSGYRGGLKQKSAKEMLQRDPRQIIILAVKRMLPKNRLSRSILKKLKVYVGNEHPHRAQVGA